MEYPLQDLDCEHETEFLLGHSSSHGNEMDVHTARNNRNPKRRRSVGSILCRYLVFLQFQCLGILLILRKNTEIIKQLTIFITF